MVNPPPLDTSMIALLCYFDHGAPITKANFLAAFQTYTEYDNYIDGIVYVWSDTYTGPASPYAGDYFGSLTQGGNVKLEVHVRIRTDGWILAWIERTQEYGLITWMGSRPNNGNTTPPTNYSTRLARAIYILLDEAGIESGFSYETSVGYFDYEYVTATKLYMFGRIWCQSAFQSPAIWMDQYYHTVPNSVTIRRARLAYDYYWGSNSYSRWGRVWLYYDTHQLYYSGNDYLGGWNGFWYYMRAVDVLAYMELGVQHHP